MNCAKDVLVSLPCTILLSVLSPSVAFAEPEPRKMGDWLVFATAKNPIKYDNSEAVHSAVTIALDGRKEGALGIGGCGRFSVGFTFEPDVQFDGKKPEEMNSGPSRIVYSKVISSGDDGGSLWPMVLHGADVDYFTYNADILARGAKFMMCPTQEEGPRCLTFSLKGITAALNTICPKR